MQTIIIGQNMDILHSPEEVASGPRILCWVMFTAGPWMLNQPIILRQPFQQKNLCWDDCTFRRVYTVYNSLIEVDYAAITRYYTNILDLQQPSQKSSDVTQKTTNTKKKLSDKTTKAQWKYSREKWYEFV